MSFASYTVVSLIAMLMSFPKSESATTEFIAKPSTPSPAVEGQNFTLEWNYTLDGTLGSAQFKNVSSSGSTDLIGKRFGPGIINVEPEYQERFRAQATNTRAELTILTVQRSDQGTYRIDVLPTGSGSLDDNVEVIVQYPPSITSISLNQTVDEGDVVRLNCTPEGNPEPNITWTRLSNDSIVSMPLTITGKQDDGDYRCTADNGIGNVVTSDVFIAVQSYHPINTVFSTNLTNNTVNVNETFTLLCDADANPSARYRLYREQESLEEQSNGTYLTSVYNRTKQVTYRCIPFNSFGDGPSKTVTVTVYYNPATVHLVANTTENRNCSDFLLVNFTCDASEANPPVERYQLLRRQEIVVTSSKGTWIRNISSEGDNIYSCRALHPVGDVISSHVIITFNVPVQVSVLGQSGKETLTFIEGGHVSVGCDASGYPYPSVTWFNLNTSELIRSQWLNLTNISKEEAGDYICNASNTCGEKWSLVTTIDVQYKPSNVILAANPTENENCSDFLLVNFTCEVSESNPAVENYQLLRSQEIVVTSSKGTWIRNISSEGDHIYSCRALHPVGNVTSSEVTVTFNVPVQVSVHVKSGSETLLEGGSVSLNCSASGYPKPNVTWSKLYADDLIISSQCLIFTDISREASGKYICNANNTCGEKQSSVRTIDVQYKPENVSLKTSSLKVCAGKMMMLTCSAGDSNPAVENFTLYKNGLTLVNVTRGRVGVFHQMLYTQGQHNYSCVASNSVGNASSSNTIVEVEVPASVTFENRTIVVREGDNVILRCVASGFPVPNASWVNLNSNYILEAGSILNLTNISRHNREYNCSASNACGNDSRKVDIDVQYKPENVSLKTSSLKVCAGKMMMLTCSAGDSNPAVENFTLYKNGLTLVNVTRGRVGVFHQMLYTQGQHNYSCVASNVIGSASSSTTTVEVEVPASVTVENRTIVVREGENVALQCNSSGFPQPSVFWVNNSNYIMEAGSILNLTNIRRQNREYNCSASNACGTDSRRVDIDVQYAAEAAGSGENYSVPEGSTKLLSCPVDGNPEPEVAWYKGTDLNEPEISNAKQLEVTETGCYTCSASNSLGTPVTITQCLTVVRTEEPTSSTPISTRQPTKQVYAEVTIIKDFVPEYRDLNNQVSKQLVDSFVLEVDETYQPDDNYFKCEVTGLRSGSVSVSVIVSFILYFNDLVTPSKGLTKLDAAISNGTFGYQARNLTLLSLRAGTFTSTTPRTAEPTVKEGLPWTIIGAIAGSVVLVAFVVALVTWWVHKKRKCLKDTKIHNSDCEERLNEDSPHAKTNRAYAESGPPSAGTEGAARQQSQDPGAIPTYAVVDKSKKKKKTEEKPPIYATVDKSKKRKKKTDDKNLYDSVEEPKKEKKPGEVLYAELGDFQNPAMPEVSTSPATLPPLKRTPSYEQTQYADITAFLKGDATLPQKEGNEGSEMQQQSANQSQHDVDNKETPM